jgi:hypothetical protein
MSAVRVHEFAIQLVHMGCTLAMQLDITGHRPQFAWYDGLGTMDRTANLLHAAMQTPNRYLQHSIMNFVALFDPATLPPGAVA